MTTYWYSRLVFERALALIYLVGFLVAANQFVPLLGEHGLEPVSRFVRFVPFRASPSLFFFAPTDTAFRHAAWVGVALSLIALAGLTDRLHVSVTAVLWAAMWMLYLSFVNVGQTFYGFGWETLLLESGFLAIFLGSGAAAPNAWLNWAYRWLLFRVMFGAGLIKLRGDPCWRDLSCLNYYFETQPMPNPLSWYLHWLPASVHRAGAVVNHVAELGVPFAYFAPQPVASIAGLVTIAFQLILIVSGNLSWLNWLTIVLCIPAIDDRFLSWLPLSMPVLYEPQFVQRLVVYAVVGLVALLSIAPARNMLSPAQVMNTSFDPLHIVNTYGAFGSITRERNEIVIEGTEADAVTASTTWREYEFKGKPGDLAHRPSQFAPYHLRLDWLMWFAAFSTPDEHPWFSALLVRLLEGNRDTVSLLRTNPFPGRPPRYVRAQYYRYRFTTPDERRQTGRIWNRELLGTYFAPASLKTQ